MFSNFFARVILAGVLPHSEVPLSNMLISLVAFTLKCLLQSNWYLYNQYEISKTILRPRAVSSVMVQSKIKCCLIRAIKACSPSFAPCLAHPSLLGKPESYIISSSTKYVRKDGTRVNIETSLKNFKKYHNVFIIIHNIPFRWTKFS